MSPRDRLPLEARVLANLKARVLTDAQGYPVHFINGPSYRKYLEALIKRRQLNLFGDRR